jgi:hypothetical protein
MRAKCGFHAIAVHPRNAAVRRQIFRIAWNGSRIRPMRLAALLLAALLGSCAVASTPAYAPRPAAELVGLSAGAPQRCVPIESSSSIHVDSADHSTLIYRVGNTVWANNVSPCRLDPADVLVLQPFGMSYCEGDVVRSVESAGVMHGPSCVLNAFVPFTR